MGDEFPVWLVRYTRDRTWAIPFFCVLRYDTLLAPCLSHWVYKA